MGYIKTLNEAKELLAKREPFNAGSLTANIEDNEALLYVVRSYGVAIADTPLFLDNGGVYPTAYTHSKTTSKHANIVKRAWGLI
jgi:hypothetical protein